MNKIQPTIQRLFTLGVLAFLAYFPLVINAQNQLEKILITEGAGTISGSNKVAKVIAIDVTNYESGKIHYNIDPAPGTGVSGLNGKCQGLVEFDENGKKSAKSRDLLPAQIMGGRLPFSKPTNFTIKVSPSCDPTLSNNFTYQIFLTDAKLVTKTPNCSKDTNEENPAKPTDYDTKLSSDIKFNGKAFTITPFGVNANEKSIFYVNGIQTTLAEAENAAETLSKQSKTPVTLIYNNSSKLRAGSKYGYATFRAGEYLFSERATDWAKEHLLSNAPAAQALANQITERLSQNGKVEIVGFSQGASIIAEALRRVRKCVGSNELFCKIRVISIAGAAQRDEFPSCVKVSSLAHPSDPVSQVFGENRSNFDSKLNKFEDISFPQHSNYLEDPSTLRLIKNWVNGEDFPFQIVPDFVPSRGKNNSSEINNRDNSNSETANNGQSYNDGSSSSTSTANNGQTAFNRGLQAQNEKDYKTALDSYSTAIQQNPKNSDAFNNRGAIKQTYSDYKGAVEDYSDAIRIKPSDPAPYINRAGAKIKLQDLQGAVADSTQAIRLNPDSFSAYANRAIANYGLREYRAVINDYNEAIRINPKSADAYLGRANAKSVQQDYSGAIDDYGRAINIDPSSVSLYIARANIKNFVRDYAGALEDFNKIIQLDPQDAASFVNRGITKVYLQNYKGAIEDYTQAIRLDSSLALAYYNRAGARYTLGDYRGSLDDSNQAIRLDPNSNRHFYVIRAGAKGYLNDRIGACQDFQKACQMGDDEACKDLNSEYCKF